MKRLLTGFVLLLAVLFGCYGMLAPAPVGAAPSRPVPEQFHDPVAQLQRKMERGETQLVYTEPGGWLQSVLQQLQVPVSSQSLVFSRTSLQAAHVSPANPRAIYFNDLVYVGWIRGAELIEIAAVDPVLGSVFYTMEQKPSAQPQFIRNERCLQCHGTASTRYVNGPFVRSIYPESDGSGIGNFGSYVTDHTSPFNERWGGWYVTGTHGAQQHLGNTFFTETQTPDDLAQRMNGNLTSLADRVDLRGYASRHSDIVALMVLAHQTQMHNLIVWLDYETRMALHEQADQDKTTGRKSAELTGSARLRVNNAVDEMLKYMLFLDEARLHSVVKGTTSFASEFASQGRRDKQGRSLRDFDLQQRLFRYPCSYLIYSEAFANIPQPARDLLFRKLWLILTGQEQSRNFSSLSVSDRRAVLEILRDTKPDLPAYFHLSSEPQPQSSGN